MDKHNPDVIDLSDFDDSRFIVLRAGVFKGSLSGDFKAWNESGEGERFGQGFGEKVAAVLLPEWSKLEHLNEEAVAAGDQQRAEITSDPAQHAIDVIVSAYQGLIERGVSHEQGTAFLKGARERFFEHIQARNSLEASDLERIDRALAAAEARAAGEGT